MITTTGAPVERNEISPLSSWENWIRILVYNYYRCYMLLEKQFWTFK